MSYGINHTTHVEATGVRSTVCVVGDVPPAYDRYDEMLANLSPVGAVRAAVGPAWPKVERAAAAIAIDNARLFEQERETAKWTRASREITTALLSGDPQTGPLQLIVNRALELSEAEQAILYVQNPAVLNNRVHHNLECATCNGAGYRFVKQPREIISCFAS